MIEPIPPDSPPELNPERPIDSPKPLETEALRSGPTPAQWWVVCLVIALSAGAILYRVLVEHHLGQTAAMFIGIPALLAILLAFTPKAKSLTGGILKGITLFLLIVAPLLGEGYLCILIASPLFYLVGAAIGIIMDSYRHRKRNKTTLSCIALLMLPLSLEGIVPQLTVDREQTVEATVIVAASAQAVEAALAQSPNLGTPLPRLLRIGFPRPLTAYGGGLNVGAMRTIHFAGAEGDPPGDLVSRVTQHSPGFVRVDTLGDTTKLTQWLEWQSSEVTWRAIDAQHTSVSWRIRFERRLDPAWYFTSWERVAVRQAAEYMIQANATPHPEQQGGHSQNNPDRR